MKHQNYLLFTLLVFSFLQNSYSQQEFVPTFSAFNGTAYNIPSHYKKLKEGYNDSIEYKLEWLGDIVLNKLDIPVRADNIWMDGIYQNSNFAIIFEFEMEIKKDGLYEFSLNSDDGSILWIDGKMILDNDGIHKMKMVKDTIELAKGTYPIKIWYYQAYPDRYGLQFKSSFFKEKSIIRIPKKTVFPSHQLNFENNIYGIDNKGKALLEKFSEKIRNANIRKITIIGHTDSVAGESYNNELSWKRANAVCNELKQFLARKNIQFIVIGKGESEPIVSNKTEEGRAKNRRVVVLIE